jgi:acetylornithine aminotransferase
VPIGSMCCKEQFNVFGPGDHASTYGCCISLQVSHEGVTYCIAGGNPLACAAGMAVTEAFEKDHLVENAKQRGEQLRCRWGY